MQEHDNAALWSEMYRKLGVSPPGFDDRPLGSHLEAHAANIPQALAIRYLDREIQYLELNLKVNKLANALAELGVTEHSVVGILLPNIPQFTIALLAAAKIGCTVSGVSPLLTPPELSHQINDAGIDTLFGLDETIDQVLPQIAPALPTLKNVIHTRADDLLQDASSVKNRNIEGAHNYVALTEPASDHFLQRDVAWDSTFLLQYTGGTTGRPKGAMLSLRSIMHNQLTSAVYRPWELGTEHLACAMPMFHIGGASIHLTAIRFGGSATYFPNARDIDHLCEQMAQLPPTRIGAVPALYEMLIDHPKIGNVDFSKLKIAMTGAAPITGDTRKRIESVIGENMLCDYFGMSETGPTYVVNPPDMPKPAALGIPVPSAELRIVDVETGEKSLPNGEPGEIITSGPHVMKGYLNLPAETEHALRKLDGKTWMYTGDVGYIDDDGYLYISDRAKDMLIVGGYKVFSLEIEDKLADLEFIASSAIVGTPDTARPGNDVVNLFVQLSDSSAGADEDEVRDSIINYCRANMAPYKVPKLIHFVDLIPLTAVGKKDKKLMSAHATQLNERSTPMS